MAASAPFLGGTIRAVRAVHGHGFIGSVMGDGRGWVVRLPGEPSVFLTFPAS